VLIEGGSVSDGRRSRSTSLRQQRILPASVIRALPKGRALVWVTGSKVAMIRTLPWYAGPRAGEVDAARRAAEAEMTTNTGSVTASASAAAAGVATGSPRGAGEAA
jgi:type IV secretory pathway TraG/TraD family ATPase VirD4